MASNYEQLVKALRCKRDDCEGCDIAFFDKDEGWMCRYAAKDDDAADAIEALQAELDQWKAAVKGHEDGIKVLQAEVERLQVDVETAYALMEVQE